MAALAKAGTETEDDKETGRSAEYMRSPMKVSQISRAISIVVAAVVVVVVAVLFSSQTFLCRLKEARFRQEREAVRRAENGRSNQIKLSIPLGTRRGE